MTSSINTTVEPLIEHLLPRLIELRHDLHRHPELAYEEKRTSAMVVKELSTIPGIEIQSGLAETGIVATLGGALKGPCVALRADMDALPIEEETGVSYASEYPGKMHACGHDGHTVMLLGAAKVLGEIQDQLKGPVKFIFQPAEEGGAGGRKMVEAGALKGPDVDAVFGLHNMPQRETQVGQIAHCPGAAMAGTGTFHIVIEGKGGHAAFPHECVDPIYIGTQLVQSLQGIVSRQMDPIAAGVLTVTQFHAGAAYNVIPRTAEIKGTIRALDPQILEYFKAEIEKRATGLAQAMGAKAIVRVTINYPVLINHPKSDQLFFEVLNQIGRTADLRKVPPMMGGEDFAFYQLEVPGTFWFLPAREADADSIVMCHHPQYDFNDAIIADGVRVHVELARRFADLWK